MPSWLDSVDNLAQQMRQGRLNQTFGDNSPVTAAPGGYGGVAGNLLTNVSPVRPQSPPPVQPNGPQPPSRPGGGSANYVMPRPVQPSPSPPPVQQPYGQDLFNQVPSTSPMSWIRQIAEVLSRRG
jgi:hypothetical protein